MIELIRNAPKTDTVYGDIKLANPVQTIQTIADHLLAEGVIVPPCKVGQTVWFIRNEKIIETKIDKIVLKHGGLYLLLSCNSFYETTCRSIGKTIFLTREEAEKALERSENDGT